MHPLQIHNLGSIRPVPLCSGTILILVIFLLPSPPTNPVPDSRVQLSYKTPRYHRPAWVCCTKASDSWYCSPQGHLDTLFLSSPTPTRPALFPEGKGNGAYPPLSLS